MKDISEIYEEHLKQVVIIIVLLLFISYSIISTYMDSKKTNFGHESGIIITFGILISLLLFQVSDYFIKESYENANAFFLFGLPLIVFANGFNMKRQRIFINLSNIFKLGFLGTLLNWIIYSLLTIGLFKFTDFHYTVQNGD